VLIYKQNYVNIIDRQWFAGDDIKKIAEKC
jgi:hypothetical protein